MPGQSDLRAKSEGAKLLVNNQTTSKFHVRSNSTLSLSFSLVTVKPTLLSLSLSSLSLSLSLYRTSVNRLMITSCLEFQPPMAVSVRGPEHQKGRGEVHLFGKLSIIGGSCHKYHFCRDKIRLLSRQKYACRDKTFVATNVLPRQAYFCRNKRRVLSCLSRQNFCRDNFFYLW